MTNFCPKCGHGNRDEARFCAGCGGPLTPPSQPPAKPVVEAAEKVKEVASKAGEILGPKAAQAGAAVAPIAREAAAKSWESSKKGMSFFARVMTGGGRAAYTEIFHPLPVAGGRVLTPPSSTTVPVPVEGAALLFVAVLLFGWLVFLLPPWGIVGALAGVCVLLLVLSWLGVRRPYFSKLTFSGLWDRILRRGQASQVPLYKFQVQDASGGQPLNVVMLGQRQGGQLAQGAQVQLWGILDKGRNELRAWKIETLDAAGQPVTITAPKLIPLTVALFLPPVLMGVVGLLIVLLS